MFIIVLTNKIIKLFHICESSEMLRFLPLVGGREEKTFILYFGISLFWSSSNNKKDYTFMQVHIPRV